MPRNTTSVGGAAQARTAPLDDHSRVGLDLLWQAYLYAQDAGAEPWDFALEIGKLYETGLNVSDLRWLVAKRFAVHGQETSVYGGPHRSFCLGDGFFFQNTTCVVLTTTGAAFTGHFIHEATASPQATRSIETASWSGGETAALENHSLSAIAPNGWTAATSTPSWNLTRRVLSLGGEVVKAFRVPAPNQELILQAFEEEGWPELIDDPLPVSADIDPPTRLHDAINRLNGRQQNRLLGFHGNGQGDGVSWRRREPAH